MHSILWVLTTTLLTSSLAIPISNSDIPSSIDTSEIIPAVSRVDSSQPIAGTVLVMPPPLFDPPEPRPDPLFGPSGQSYRTSEMSRLKAPPIPESRTETLLPFDGAHVHPFATPYTPESLPGTCAHSLHCSLARTSAEIAGTILFLLTIVYAVFYVCDKLVRRILWTATSNRTRTLSGSLRIEPELGYKLPTQRTTNPSITPLVKVWSESGNEKVILTR